MKRTSTFVIIGTIVTLLAGILNGQSAFEVRAAAATAVSGWQQMSTPGGEALWVAPGTRLTAADIERAEARVLPDSGPAVAVVFTDAGAKKMAALAAEQSDKPIALLLDGKVIWAPVMRGAIGKEAVLTGGPGGLTKAQVERLLQSFKK